MSFLKTHIFKKSGKREQEIAPAVKTSESCLSDEILMDYVCHDLDDDRQKDVSEHLEQCASCHATMVEMESLRKLWEPDLEEAYQRVLKEISPVSESKRSPATVVRTFLSTYRFKSSVQPAYRFLNPEAESGFSGNMLMSTAANSSHWEGEHDIDIGHIRLSSVLQDKTDNAPVGLGLRWDFKQLVPESEFDIRLVNPETQETRYKIRWKTVRQTNEIFLSKEKLGFDPFREKWDISIATYRRDAQ